MQMAAIIHAIVSRQRRFPPPCTPCSACELHPDFVSQTTFNDLLIAGAALFLQSYVAAHSAPNLFNRLTADQKPPVHQKFVKKVGAFL
jgi:hypothetical protein